MRKKDILGNFVKNPDVTYSYAMNKYGSESQAYTALITFLAGCRELYVDNDGERVCLAGKGYRWLMYLPLDEHWCITAFYRPDGELLQWYFDISMGNFLDEDGMPCIDDLYLDLVILPDGRALTIDEDELQEALDEGAISADEYRHAYKIRDAILMSKWNDIAHLKSFFGELLSTYP